ncbi:MAG: formylglycine-generating enzyme family protein [Elusimicrobia bacterium]|nr:formylglycine-generating enzyme family protein [Elusimicrobiota bacterium]
MKNSAKLAVAVIAIIVVGAWLLSCRGRQRRVAQSPVPVRSVGAEPAAAPAAPKALTGAAQAASGPAGLQWMSIPGGTFSMGTSDPDGDFNDAKPAHQATIRPFEMTATLVTNGQYQTCVKAGACTAPQDYGPSFDGASQPVVGVDWNQAQAFAKWAGGRLPSEAEWEYAARSAGQAWKYPWGNEAANCDRAVLSGCGWNATAPVCSKPSGNTKQGLCDMAGNSWEWVEDWYHANYNGAPQDGSAWVDPAGTSRSNRGGSWKDNAACARAADRNDDDPPTRNNALSFRLAR